VSTFKKRGGNVTKGKSEPIAKDVYQVGGGSLTSPEDAGVYLVRSDDRAALVDAGCGFSQSQLFNNIEACGVSLDGIEYLLITHCHFDHTGGAQAVKDRTGCRIVAHEREAGFLEEGDQRVTAAKWYGAFLEPLQVDVKLNGERQDLWVGQKRIEALHVPGHSPGSVVYVTESDGLKILFGQDVHGPLDASLLSNRDDYHRSLQLLLSLRADVLCEGHYGVFRGKDEVADFIESFL
jgi:glyoxylase-like metal-dependent hydrolase (beta-lactamase superfamily II)